MFILIGILMTTTVVILRFVRKKLDKQQGVMVSGWHQFDAEVSIGLLMV